MNKETVIPAFPWCGDLNDCPTINLGMTLRDYFAAKAIGRLIGLCTSYSRDAEEAYKMADAMLEARK